MQDGDFHTVIGYQTMARADDVGYVCCLSCLETAHELRDVLPFLTCVLHGFHVAMVSMESVCKFATNQSPPDHSSS